MEIGKAIKSIRKKKCLSQKELAKRVGITTTTLYYIESDRNFPTKKNIYKICEELEISPAVLFVACVSESDMPSGKEGIWPVFDMLRKYFGFDNDL